MTEDPRISEIRAVLDEEIPSDQTFDVGNFVKLQRIRDIIDRPAPAPRVFLPNERVPVGAVITGKDGSPFRVPDVHASEGLVGVAVPFVEVTVPTPEEWQDAVDRARAEREDAERQHTEGTNP